MKRFQSALAVCIAVLVVSFGLARIHPFGDAGLYSRTSAGWPLMEYASVPTEVRATLIAKCADCHSTATRVPVYGRLAPASWLMERDILRARSAMNLSQWEYYSAEEQETLRGKILHETRAHAMPPPQYQLIHWNSRITSADIQAFQQWAQPASTSQTVTEGDAARGKAVFEKRCTGCHAIDQNREGPHLRGVFGRTSGTVPDFTYSAALKNAHIVWNETTLDKWLTDPDAFVPGNNMDFRVIKPQERQDLIRFLRDSLSK